MGITKELTNYIARTRFVDLPPNVVKLAKQLLLDELGCVDVRDQDKFFVLSIYFT